MHFRSGSQQLTGEGGRAISTAVDLVEVMKINLGTDVIDEGAEARNVSTIETKLVMNP